MKKIVALLAIAIAALTVGVVTAQTSANSTMEGINSYADISTQVIFLDDNYAEFHQKAKRVDLQMEYTPLTGEVRFYYTCMAANFEQGEAMNTALAVYEDFAAKNQFKKYTYQGKDRTRYYKDARDIRMAQYISYVVFTR